MPRFILSGNELIDPNPNPNPNPKAILSGNELIDVVRVVKGSLRQCVSKLAYPKLIRPDPRELLARLDRFQT